MDNKLQLQILPVNQKKLLDILSDNEWICDFYLVGETGLALQLGHRQSIDFDFFSSDNFNNKNIINKLNKSGQFQLFSEAENTINGSENDVKVSFFKYDYPLLKKPFKYNALAIADIDDIALMKLQAISGRGSKKDFVDLYYLLRIFSLTDLFIEYEKKYGVGLSNSYHLLKSLAYFDDAEREVIPVLFEKIEWDTIKSKITQEVKKIFQPG